MKRDRILSPQPIPSYNGYYEVDTYGNVFSRILRGSTTIAYNSRLLIPLNEEYGPAIAVRVERSAFTRRLVKVLVAITFLGWDSKIHTPITHKDGNISNNRVQNLRFTNKVTSEVTEWVNNETFYELLSKQIK